MQRVPPARHHYVFWFGTVPVHTPTPSPMHKSTPLFFCPPFLPLRGLWTDGWGEDAKGGRPSDTTTCSGWAWFQCTLPHPLKHHRPCHPPTHSSTTGLATHPPPSPPTDLCKADRCVCAASLAKIAGNTLMCPLRSAYSAWNARSAARVRVDQQAGGA
eukprot:scaffold25703_cov140-Isochrysis_galbana.AAC.1